MDYRQLRQKRTESTDSEIPELPESEKKNIAVNIEQLNATENTPPADTPQPATGIERENSPRIPARRAPSSRSRRPPPRYRDYIAKIINMGVQDLNKSH